MTTRSRRISTLLSSSYRGGGGCFYDHTYSYYLGLGSNLGDRFRNLREAVRLLEQEEEQNKTERDDRATMARATTRVTRVSFLYESAPMYKTDQPSFLNAAVKVLSPLDPPAMLRRIKRIEQSMGRETDTRSPFYVKNGPRPIDMDILLAHSVVKQHEDDGGGAEAASVGEEEEHVPIVMIEQHCTRRSLAEQQQQQQHQQAEEEKGDFATATLHQCDLTIPHPRIAERLFVLKPLMDVAGPGMMHPTLRCTLIKLAQNLLDGQRSSSSSSNSSNSRSETESAPSDRLVRVLPLPRGRLLYLNETLVMGILNVTPDSFSGDGGLAVARDPGDDIAMTPGEDSAGSGGAERAVRRGLRFIQEGANILDVGGESTRPGADPVDLGSEMQRVVPVIETLRELGAFMEKTALLFPHRDCSISSGSPLLSAGSFPALLIFPVALLLSFADLLSLSRRRSRRGHICRHSQRPGGPESH
jgi:2-amino-4-hydroxy-6-hydroxymethyldihydropteridine diphosphokinase